MKKSIIVLYSIFLSLFSIFSYLFVDPNLLYLRSIYSDFTFSSRLLTSVFYISFIIVFFIFYGIFINLLVKKKLNTRDVFLLIGITFVILFFSYPAMLSYDIFNYIATSKVLFFYQENPYVIMPFEFTADPLLAFTRAANKIALYGPFWILLTGFPYVFGFGNFITTLIGFKFLIGFFYLASVFIFWKISKNIITVLLFALNPLIVIETLVSGHNDIVMVFLAILSFFLLMGKKTFLAVLFLILSILIKYATVLLVPIFLYMLFNVIKKREIDWKSVFYLSSLLMTVGFLLSPIREEIYPWYAIWFLPFSFLVPNKKLLLYISIAFSFGLMFRYVPFIFSGTHVGITPTVKSIVTFVPSCLVLFYFLIKKKLGKT